MFRSFLSLLILTLISACSSADDAPGLPAASIQADFVRLYDGLKSGHVALYANRSEAEYDRLYSDMLAGFDQPMTEAEIYRAFQAFTAFGDVAHASINAPDGIFGGEEVRVFPIYLRIVDGISYVGDDYSGLDLIKPGQRIVSLNGKPMSYWLDQTSTLLSADTAYIAHSLLEFRFPAYLWLDQGDISGFDLVVETSDGQSLAVSVPALSRDEQMQNREAASGVFELEFNAREARLINDTLAYLRPGPFYNFEDPNNTWDTSAFTSFIDQSFAEFIEVGAQTLIIDLRSNPGGDNSFSDQIVAWFADRPFVFASDFRIKSSQEAEAANQARLDANPEAVAGVSGLFATKYAETPHGEVFSFALPAANPREGDRFLGEVYVLVNRHSYSQAVNVAATVQDYGWGIIAGEPSADFATTFGSVETFTLPETGFVVNFPKAHIIRPSGDEIPGGVQPDLALDSPVISSASDTVLEALIAHIVELEQ